VKQFQIPLPKLKNFFLEVCHRYRRNPFHNWSVGMEGVRREEGREEEYGKEGMGENEEGSECMGEGGH